MHLVDGALTTPVIATATVLAAGGVALGLKRLDPERLPRAALLSAAFFVASLIHVPVGPASVHLVLSGLMGVLLGWSAFPVILVALLLQAVFFGYGGITVLGVNTLNMALPAVLCGLLFRPLLARAGGRPAALLGALAGAVAIALDAALTGLSLFLSGREFVVAAQLIFTAHIPVMVVEAFLTAAAVGLVHKVRPELLATPRLTAEELGA
jgi:cobalt/nickel transport system permease protein